MYSPQLLDHFENPRNAGTVESPEAAAQIENPVCGDVLALSARISEGRITQIKFRAKGCVPAMACASALTELAAGKTMAEAAAIKKESLITAIGGIPQASTHAVQLALEALGALLRSAQPRAVGN